LPDIDQEILDGVQDRLGCRLHGASSVVRRDHVSIAVGLLRAQELIAQRQAPCCIVAGVDSLIQQDLVEYYLNKRRLLTERNSNGFSVGEAGSAVLVVPGGPHSSGELQILGIGMARERATIESEEPLRAEGLIQSIRGAFAASATTYEDVQYRITDLNGEHYKFKEMAQAMVRFQRKAKPKLFDLWHPIEYIGDVGAAIGPIVLGLALHAGQKGYGNGPGVLCTFGNDDGERAAIVVRYQAVEGER
jgi:3-oxoacyl-[acyl-carrier-protein] synthase-1